MLPSRHLHRGRVVLAVAVSVALHAGLVLSWLAVQPVGGQGGHDFSTEVDAPSDGELTITLREPPARRAIEPKKESPPPAKLPETMLGPGTPTHAEGCSQIRKRGGEHAHGQGEYHDHGSLPVARHYAEQTGLPVIECSYCKPGDQTRS